jgi:hypothetical protein|tara:strand:+ start:5485 stop:5658 length:174 start_codon:yes stop_codon:yes gene_type:complete
MDTATIRLPPTEAGKADAFPCGYFYLAFLDCRKAIVAFCKSKAFAEKSLGGPLSQVK